MRDRVRYEASRAARVARDQRRWREMLRTPPATGEPRVYYGIDRLPAPDDVVSGGFVKFQLLAEQLPNAPRDFNVLYLGSSSLPLDAAALVRVTRRRGARFAWNQNGVAYRAWFGDGWERANRLPARLHREADLVLYQSEFCRLSAERFLGRRSGRSEVLYNPVDTTSFTPAEQRPERPLTLLLGGSQYQRYRLDTALETLALLPEARLVVTGSLSWSAGAEHEGRELARSLGVAERVEFVGPYTRAQAPDVLRRGDILLHTKVNDPCPMLVLEAMACGLPVVYSATGGVPELVGADAGIGVAGEIDWERDRPPAPEALAAGVAAIEPEYGHHAASARNRAVDFDVRRWSARHRELFGELT
jgi:glycosyltransferase involved in cell wall biosynthesis